ncbi:hypothetical protein [Streptomyces sp. NPDC059072]|uniref:hypothetical protein n=1 Tax=unclassified Streptomyces TaxID=2593676 RepID=UPI0036C70C12
MAAISPFVTAFATSLGERLGTSVKVRRQARRQRGEANNLVLTHRARVTTIEVGTGLSDEAQLALIDLDLTRPELRGHHLRWSEEAAAWLPVPDTPASEGAS